MKNKSLWGRIGGMMVALCLVLALPTPRVAQAAPAAPGFTVHAVLPENQLEAQSYFALWTPPSHRQTLEVVVENHLSTPLSLRIEISSAYSGAGGVIIYDPQGSETMAQSPALPDLLTWNPGALAVGMDQPIQSVQEGIITIAAHATVSLPFALSLPEEPLAGQVLGGIVFTKQEEAQDAQATFAISSVYSYAIAVQLQNEPQLLLQPGFALEGARLEQRAGYPALVVALRNEAPLVVTGARLRLRLHYGGELLLEHEAGRIAMAPGSHMPYAWSLPMDQALSPGEYTLQAEIEYQSQNFAMEFALRIE